MSSPNRSFSGKRAANAWLVVILATILAAGLPLALQAADFGNAGKVASATGRVSVIRNSELVALFEGNDVRVGEMIITGPDGLATLQISDGSYFEVYPNSRVVFRANPGNLRDLVELVLGKVRVHIQKFGATPNPYKVHSPTAVISVRGTVFEVEVSDDITFVGVDEGTVTVQHRLLPSNKAIELGPGQSIRIFPNSPLAAAGIDKARMAERVANAAREALYILRTVSRPGSSRVPGVPGGTSGPPSIPTDTQAPPPPPPPPPPPSGTP